MLGKVKGAVADAAETLRRVFSDPEVRELRPERFGLRVHPEWGPVAIPQAGWEPVVAALGRMPRFEDSLQAQSLAPLQATLRCEDGWARWGAEATVVRMAPLEAGQATRMAVPPLPRSVGARSRLEALSGVRTRQAREPLPPPGTRRLDPALAPVAVRPGLAAMLAQPVAIQGEDLQKLPKGLWMRYSLQMVRATGENVRNLEVLGLFHLPRKGVGELRHDAKGGRILVQLAPEAAKAPRLPFILARRRDDGALLSCYLEEP